MVGEPAIAPRPPRDQTVCPFAALNALTSPPALPATTMPRATDGVPSTAPARRTRHVTASLAAAAESSVAVNGWPSPPPSPREVGPTPPGPGVGTELTVAEPHAARAIAA